jgi:hypothetical protein
MPSAILIIGDDLNTRRWIAYSWLRGYSFINPSYDMITGRPDKQGFQGVVEIHGKDSSFVAGGLTLLQKAALTPAQSLGSAESAFAIAKSFTDIRLEERDLMRHKKTVSSAMLFVGGDLNARIEAARAWEKAKQQLAGFHVVVIHGPYSSFIGAEMSGLRKNTLNPLHGLSPEAAFEQTKTFPDFNVEESDLSTQERASDATAYVPPLILFKHRTTAESAKFHEYWTQIAKGTRVTDINLRGELITDREVNLLMELIDKLPARESVQSLDLSETLIQAPYAFELPAMRDFRVNDCINLEWFNFSRCPQLTLVDAQRCPSLNLCSPDLGQIFRECPALDGKNVNFTNSGLSEATRKFFADCNSEGRFSASRKPYSGPGAFFSA